MKNSTISIYAVTLLSVAVLLNSCQKADAANSSLKVYVEDPALFYALSIYQQQVDPAPISVHLRQGLDMFFQLSGGERPIDPEGTTRIIEQQNGRGLKGLDNSVPRLALGGGLFLSRELMQLAEQKPYLEKLPKDLAYPHLRQESGSYVLESDVLGSDISSDLAAHPYLTPILLYPTIFEISNQTDGLAPQVELDSGLELDPLMRNFTQSKLLRLLNQDWLKEQLIEAPSIYQQGKTENSGKRYARFENPRQALLEYLKAMHLELSFHSDGFDTNETQMPLEFQQFVRDYGNLFQIQAGLEQPLKTEPEDQRLGDIDIANKLHAALSNSGIEFAQQQQLLYQNIPKGYNINYRSTKTPIEPSSYSYLYLKGQLLNHAQHSEHPNATQPVLKLQLEQILWAGISKGLSREHRQQAFRVLAWLQSRKGQQILQQELPQLDGDNTLGIYRGLSLYPELNTQFWQNLQLDWPERFDIHWKLPHTLVKWNSSLFNGLSFEQEHLYRSHSSTSVMNSFLLPYLFLPQSQSLIQQQNQQVLKDREGGEAVTDLEASSESFHRLDWSLWLQPNE